MLRLAEPVGSPNFRSLCCRCLTILRPMVPGPVMRAPWTPCCLTSLQASLPIRQTTWVSFNSSFGWDGVRLVVLQLTLACFKRFDVICYQQSHLQSIFMSADYAGMESHTHILLPGYNSSTLPKLTHLLMPVILHPAACWNLHV